MPTFSWSVMVHQVSIHTSQEGLFDESESRGNPRPSQLITREGPLEPKHDVGNNKAV